MSFASGEGLEHCPAAHAETNAIANAARTGANIHGSTLYMNSIIPCKFCAVSIVNAGIKEIVIESLIAYHDHDIFKHGNVNIRLFESK
jgi:dCMP deaminase